MNKSLLLPTNVNSTTNVNMRPNTNITNINIRLSQLKEHKNLLDKCIINKPFQIFVVILSIDFIR